jgi:2-dehydropantoate 2-reductase
MKWSKLLLNLPGVATSALTAWPPDRALGETGLWNLEHRAWMEALAVMDALGYRPVALPGYPVDLIAAVFRRMPSKVLQPLVRRFMSRRRGAKLPGMAADLQAGRATEVDVMHGAIARLGGPVAPVNRAMANLIGAVAASQMPREWFRGDPEAILSAVAGAL